MRSYQSLLENGEGLILLLIALVLLFARTAFFLRVLREGSGRRRIPVSALHLLAVFLLFVILLDAYDIGNYPSLKITRSSMPLAPYLLAAPWPVYAGCEVLLAAALLLHFREYRRYKRVTVTPDAIRRSLDLLPEGICVSSPDGTVRLSNLKMDSLCRELTGERLFDARMLWAFLENVGEDQGGRLLVHIPRGGVWLFAKDSLAAEGSIFERISATEVTGRYRVTEELREKNAHLQEIQRRMKEASELSSEMFVMQEEARARSALHNELGQVLLMGRHYIEHPDTTDASVVALMTRQMNRFLLGESRAFEAGPGDELAEACGRAAGIGVTVSIKGEPPEEGAALRLLCEAIRECAANTVKHAEGSRLFVDIARPFPESLVITVTNDGRPPNGPVAESGGLLSLRRSAEDAGADMKVQSEPVFSLTLSFPAV